MSDPQIVLIDILRTKDTPIPSNRSDQVNITMPIPKMNPPVINTHKSCLGILMMVDMAFGWTICIKMKGVITKANKEKNSHIPSEGQRFNGFIKEG